MAAPRRRRRCVRFDGAHADARLLQAVRNRKASRPPLRADDEDARVDWQRWVRTLPRPLQVCHGRTAFHRVTVMAISLLSASDGSSSATIPDQPQATTACLHHTSW